MLARAWTADVPGMTDAPTRRADRLPASRRDRAMMARALAFVFFAGPSSALVWVALPGADPADVRGLIAVCLTAWVVGAVLLLVGPEGLSDRALQATLAAATVCITLVTVFSGSLDSGFATFYVWTTPYAFFFLSRRQAALQTAFVGVCFGAALAGRNGVLQVSDRLGTWLIVTLSVVMVGVLVRRLAQELERRVRQQEALARVGELALRAHDLDVLVDDAARTVAQTLHINHCSIRLADPADDPAPPQGAGREGSGIRVGIDGRRHTLGTLRAAEPPGRTFGADDLRFAQAVARVLSIAVERNRADEAHRHAALTTR
jgi:hypothetical protein